MNSKIKALKSRLAGGVIPAMATPIDATSGEINLAVLGELIDFLISSGVRGLFIGGTTGEGILLSVRQRMTLHESSMEIIQDRIPALIHVGANTTRESISLAKHAADIDADGIVAVTPYYYPIHDEAIFNHYQAITSQALETPFFVYDIPQMAINGISTGLVVRMSTSIPTFAGWKSSNGDSRMVRALIDATPGDKILLVGNEMVALGNLSLGADGLISGLSTAVPEPFVNMLASFSNNKFTEARSYQQTINQILPILPRGARIGAIKRLLQQRGFQVGDPVPPRPMVSEDWQGWQEISGLLDH